MSEDWAWHLARFNAIWWLSYAPYVLYGACLVLIRRRYVRSSIRTYAMLGMALFSVVAGTMLTISAIGWKWQIRTGIAPEAVWAQDGANLLFAPIIGAGEGVLMIVLVSWIVGRWGSSSKRRTTHRAPCQP